MGLKPFNSLIKDLTNDLKNDLNTVPTCKQAEILKQTKVF